MEETRKILRKSIHVFLKNYQYFTSTSVLLALPFSISILLSQTPKFSPSLPSSPSSNFKNTISQTIFTSIFTLPFSLSFFLISKASIIQVLKTHNPSLPFSSSPSFLSLYKPLLLTHLCNFLLIITINTTAFSLIFLSIMTLRVFGFFEYNNHPLFLFVSRGILYYLLANNAVNCNLALVVAGMDNSNTNTSIGYLAIYYKVCLVRKGRNSMVVLLALFTSMALSAIRDLFRFRVLRGYDFFGKVNVSMAMEGVLIAYLYSIIIVLDTIITCIFFKNCTSNFQN